VIDPILSRIAGAVGDGGLNLVAAFAASRWEGAGALLDGARSVIVVASGGRALWARFTEWVAEAPRERFADEPHPLERYVRGLLERAERVLVEEGGRARRLEPTFLFQPRVDFRRLAELAGLGAPSPIGMAVHPIFGPWWALRGAWVVDRAIEETAALARPCEGCMAPCRAAIPPGTEGTIAAATRVARLACVLGESRYSDEQLLYHYEPAAGRERVLARIDRRA